MAILVFWVATTGWFASREVWPRLFSGQEPPPYAIDLADEVQAIPTAWTISREGKAIGTARTWVKYHEPDDSFEMHGWFNLKRLVGGMAQAEITSMYRVSRDGDLREVESGMAITVALLLQRISVKGQIHGLVTDGRFHSVGSVTLPGQAEPEKVLFDPVAVAGHGSVLNPLHPVNRITGLRPGQRWRMPLYDPVGAALAAAVPDDTRRSDPLAATIMASLAPGGKGHTRDLDAEVLPRPRPLVWGDREESCLVIEYRSEELTARTWLRQRDGLVLRQEATLLGDQMILERTPEK